MRPGHTARGNHHAFIQKFQKQKVNNDSFQIKFGLFIFFSPPKNNYKVQRLHVTQHNHLRPIRIRYY